MVSHWPDRPLAPENWRHARLSVLIRQTALKSRCMSALAKRQSSWSLVRKGLVQGLVQGLACFIHEFPENDVSGGVRSRHTLQRA
jgi:hypothetical protein